MGKMRVHELAKELGLENKALLDILSKKKVEVKNHMNSLSEEIVSEVRKEFGKKAQGGENTTASAAGVPKKVEDTAPKKAASPKAEEEPAKKAEETASRKAEQEISQKVEGEAAKAEDETVPKKKKIVQIFRPQNAKNAGRMSGSRSGARPQGQSGRPQRAAGARLQGAPGARPQGARPQANSGVRPQGVPGGHPQSASGTRPQGAPETRFQGTAHSQETAGVRVQASQEQRQETAVPAKELSMQKPQKTVTERQKAAPAEQQPKQAQPQGLTRQEVQGQAVRHSQESHISKDKVQESKVNTEEEQMRNKRPQDNAVQEGSSNMHSHGNVQNQRPRQGTGQGNRFQGNSQGNRQGNNHGSRPQGNGTEGRPRRDGAEGRPSRDGQGSRFNKNQGSRFQGSGQRNRFQGERSGMRPGGSGQGDRPQWDRDKSRDHGSQSYGGGQRGSGRPGIHREDRDSLSTPMVEQQKSQRNKGKDKEKDYKKKELRDSEFENKGKKGKKQKPIAEAKKPPQKAALVEEIKQIILPEVLTLKELADKMKIVPSVIVKKLFLQGKVVTVNQEIDYDTAEEIAMEFNILCEKEEVVDVIEELLKEEEEDENTMEKRPPVVCVMGHVDHGKTSLLDAIRHTNVIDREAGGITQHIGAYVVEVNGEKITFLDTPGHEAFTAMRMRGANSTDIAILVVAADDGVMPQTIEAINHAKAAGIEIIVAINKIDKPSANVERVKQELTEYELIAEDWGGSTIFVPVSAHTGEGLSELLEMILLTAEVQELKANPNREARGLVIEAQLDKGKGSVATVLVQKGTLHVGDAIAAGSAHGKVRAMMDDKGRRVKVAGPSQPVEILGLNDVPKAGEIFVGCGTEKEARNFAETFISQNKVKLLEDTKTKMSLDDLFSQIQEGNLKELNIVVKADVQGSVEALKQSLLKLSNEEVVIKIIHGGVGAINESDVTLASASNAIIIGFNVRPDATAKEIADHEGVDLRLYRVIYNAIEDVEAAMKGMLDPIFEEKVLGHAEVRQTFKASGVGTIAGAYVQDGIFERNCSVRLTRDNVVMFDGPLASLRRFKDDVKEVRAGYECGFVFENYNDIQEGDSVEAYKMVEVERK
ncbi:MAG: translation initiation factor IF-2 [Ruminococcus sp.]|nr:translation initiation factor IF-2 [Ruminococcus sp.]